MKREKGEIGISIVMITLGRESIYKTFETILNQKISQKYEVVLILQGTLDQERIKKINKNKIDITIHNYPFGLGFGKYRNEGIKHAKGDVIVFIDDDEWTKNDLWLKAITEPLFKENYLAVNSGYQVPLIGKYFTDCISLLGYPGGGALGYEKMWQVDENGNTNHICTGNFAFHKKLSMSFNEGLKFGAEDADFGSRIHKKGIKIKYVPEATVFHVHRSGFWNFTIWHMRRGRSIYEYKKLGLLDKNTVSKRSRAVKNIFKNVLFTKYIFGVTFFFFWQYFISGIAYLKAKFEK